MSNHRRNAQPSSPPADPQVYRLRRGLYELVVAAGSRTAALEAWGARENLFALGLANALLNDPATRALAQSLPGIVLGRRIGTRDRFKPVGQMSAFSASRRERAK